MVVDTEKVNGGHHEEDEDIQEPACLTAVNRRGRHGVGPLGGARVVWGVRIDEELKNRVQPKLRHYWGSDCRAFETWLMAWEVAYDELIKQTGGTVNRGHTSIEIKELNVVRAQGSRRKLGVSDPIGYSVDENTIVQETVNRFTDAHQRFGAIPNRMAVLREIRHMHPEVDGRTRMALTSRIMNQLTRTSAL